MTVPLFRIREMRLYCQVMALTKCKECGHQVSKTAKACPSCGAKIKHFLDGCGVLLLVGIVLIVLLALVFNAGLPV